MVAVSTEADELVILADDLACAFGEVEGEGRLIGTKIVDIEDEFLGKILGSPPDNPADAGVNKAILLNRLAGITVTDAINDGTLWPDTLMDTTFSHRKSHSSSGTTNGATKPPLAAST